MNNYDAGIINYYYYYLNQLFWIEIKTAKMFYQDAIFQI